MELQELSVSDAVWAKVLAKIGARQCSCSSCSGTASHVDVITWAADDMAAMRLVEVRTGLPTFLQFLEVWCSCPCLQRAAVPAVLTVSCPEMALSTPVLEVLTPSRHPPLSVTRQDGLCCAGQLGVPPCSECRMGSSGEGVERAAGHLL